ncbi:Protein DBF4 like protein B [Dictyocoela muelleri]|nr:Protein DBF4 like protein B [Dictyocoela muelleri]
MRKYQIFKNEYILIEDSNNDHQPFFKEYEKKWRSNFKENENFQKKVSIKKIKNSQKNERKTKKSGYCENCYSRYTDYYDHVNTLDHRQFALDKSNYIEIDNMISTFEDVKKTFKVNSPTFRKTRGTQIDFDMSLNYCNDLKGSCDSIILSADSGDFNSDEVVPDINNFINEFLLRSEK